MLHERFVTVHISRNYTSAKAVFLNYVRVYELPCNIYLHDIKFQNGVQLIVSKHGADVHMFDHVIYAPSNEYANLVFNLVEEGDNFYVFSVTLVFDYSVSKDIGILAVYSDGRVYLNNKPVPCRKAKSLLSKALMLTQ